MFSFQLKDSELFVHKEKPDNPNEDESDYPMFGLVDKVRLRLVITGNKKTYI